MKKFLLKPAVLAVVAALTMIPVSIASGGPPNDMAMGRGQHADGSSLAISARSQPDGTDATGTIRGETAGSEAIHADVICLVVSGNEAIITGVMNRPEWLFGHRIVVHAVDNGTAPGAGSPDLLRASYFTNGGIQNDPNHPGCFLPILPPDPVEKGEIQVMDAP